MGDYHDLYLKTDVLLLTDIFEKFISTCLEYYGLDCCHYFSSPGLSQDVLLKMTGIELELISGTDIVKRHSNRNTKYMKSYDNEKPSKYITYLDANNLYGWAMSQYLTYSGFKLLNKKN